MNKKSVKIYSPSTLGHFLEIKSFSRAVLPSDDIRALAIDENFSALFIIFHPSSLG